MKRTELPAQAPSEPQTPTTSVVPSDADSTQPTTPSSALPQASTRSQSQTQSQSKASKPAVPLLPVVPVILQVPSTPRPLSKDDSRRVSEMPKSGPEAKNATAETQDAAPTETPVEPAVDASQESVKQPPAPPAAPKSWADLVRSKATPRGAGTPGASSVEPTRVTVQKNESIADVLASLGDDVAQYSDKVAFLEPRGLVNTGNMCYMNSVSWPSSYLGETMLIKKCPNRSFKSWFHAYHFINSWTT